jgi:hypothetical protein
MRGGGDLHFAFSWLVKKTPEVVLKLHPRRITEAGKCNQGEHGESVGGQQGYLRNPCVVLEHKRRL